MSRFDESTCSRARMRAACGAARADRLADGAVLEVVLRVELVELRACLPHPVADERPAGALRDALDERHVGDAIDHVVEGVVRLHPLDEQRRVARRPAPCLRPELERELAEPPLHRVERGEVVRGHLRRRDLGRERLELGTDEERLAELVRGDRADANAPVGLERDEAERGEPAERLAHRGPADVEPLGERLLPEDGARRDDPRDDLVLELARDVVGLGGDGAHDAECTNSVLDHHLGSQMYRNMPLAAP